MGTAVAAAKSGREWMTDGRQLDRYINIRLAALGQPTSSATSEAYLSEFAEPLLRSVRQKNQLLRGRLCPADSRIQSFLDRHLADACPADVPRLPWGTLVVSPAGLSRALSFPPGDESFSSSEVSSYQLPQGVLHNPKSDRRTTKGVFHIAEGGLPIPADKPAVPKRVFAALLSAAVSPPDELLTLPYMSKEPKPVRLFASLLIRPLVCPATAGQPEKTMEIRFFAPGSCVSNLDFVESIFGNAGDPDLPENDAALDVMHWTGHTGCVILAPHLKTLKKKELGLPHVSDATPRQKRDGMCWAREDELYNDGNAFKITCRDQSGVIVTLLADNYFGYCKKEVKTQIGYAANLYGMCEEEHAGGALASASYVLGEEFIADRTTINLKPATFDDSLRLLGDRVERKPQGYAVDRQYPSVVYVPENAHFNVRGGWIRWTRDGVQCQLSIRPEQVYVLPSGYRVRMERQLGGTNWRLIGTRANALLCHKPCTVSGGGKSEISKSIGNAILKGPVFIRNYHDDLRRVAEVLAKDYSDIYRRADRKRRPARPILSRERSLGSVIKLLSTSPEYTDEYNEWVRNIPQTIRQFVVYVKRYYRPEWGDQWSDHFTVDRINGFLGHELKFEGQKLVGNYLRVGYDPDGSWRIYKLRPDFNPADKVQMEDDITASVVVPREQLPHIDAQDPNPSFKLVANCESMLFQRPDDAIHRGIDVQAESDLATPGTFISNFEPLTREQAREIVDVVAEFDQYTEPMKRLLQDFADGKNGEFAVSSAHPRIVDGKPSKNPRYLQRRPDQANPREAYLAEVGARLDRGVPADSQVLFPVQAVLPGRRNNPPDKKAGIAALAVYNPVHYQELPELFMEFISSLTGKSPSTTGFGSEGALTKAPFNALWPIVDLNNALLSMIMTGYAAFTTSAGCIGPQYKVDHDISMLVPEVWCRMTPEERDPKFLIARGLLEKIEDFEHDGRKVLASRLGYRITGEFSDHFLGRIFETPDHVFPDEMLKPEKQDPDTFAEGVDAIVLSQRRVARNYFEDGSIEAACPPLKALLHIMTEGEWDGMTLNDPRLRAQFTRESVLASDWYAERLQTKQRRDVALWNRHVASLEDFRKSYGEAASDIDTEALLAYARRELERVSSPAYVKELVGTIGADPFVP